jgi:hypothetical protein
VAKAIKSWKWASPPTVSMTRSTTFNTKQWPRRHSFVSVALTTKECAAVFRQAIEMSVPLWQSPLILRSNSGISCHRSESEGSFILFLLIAQDLLRSLTVVFTRLRSRGYGVKIHINRIHRNSLLPTSLRSAPHCFFFHFTSFISEPHFVCFATLVDEHGFNALLSWSKLKAFNPLVSYKTFASASWNVTTIGIGIFWPVFFWIL